MSLPLDDRNDDHDWRHPWLRINVLLREMTQLFGDRDARPTLKVELPKALSKREKIRRGVWWN